MNVRHEVICIAFLSLCSGIYGDNMGVETLKDFHRRRVQVLAASGADLIAFETIPNKLEAKVYMMLVSGETICDCFRPFDLLPIYHT